VNVRLAVALTGIAVVGAAAAWSPHRSSDVDALLVADAAVGITIACLAVFTIERRSMTRTGPLLGVTAISWFAGSFFPFAAFVHRGSLTHVLLSYPTGRLNSARVALLVAAVYVTSAWSPIARHEAVTIAVSVAIAAAAASGHRRAGGVTRRARRRAMAVSWSYAGAIAIAAVNRVAGWQQDSGLLWLYYAVVALGVSALAIDLMRSDWADAIVVDLVTDLGATDETETVRSAISDALGDPSLVLAYWQQGDQRYVDDRGQPVDLTDPGSGRVATQISDGGQPLAALVHDAAVLTEPDVLAAVTECARLAVSNAHIRAGAIERVAELSASRRRIIEAGHLQRRRIESDIHTRVQAPLGTVAGLLERISVRCEPNPLLDELRRELTIVRSELDDLAAGLNPRALTDSGLAAALSRLPAPPGATMHVLVGVDRLRPAVETTIYYVCAEAIANVAKHAPGASVRVDVADDGEMVTAVIEDDGIGGADPALGGGLSGLIERVEGVGGTLSIVSSPSRGTRVQAIIPV
jgi:signal transduction histidine kinase